MGITDLRSHRIYREIIAPDFTMFRPAEKIFFEGRLIVDPYAVNDAVLLLSYAGDTASPFTTIA